jgi:hypothetical protein
MTDQYDPSDFQEVKPRKGGKLPPTPDRDTPFSELRQWVSNAVGLPGAVRVDTVVRFGKGEDDSMVLTLSNGLVIRCAQQKRLHTPKGFQTFFMGESDGLCLPKYLSAPEIGDVWGALCRLATATAEQDELSELGERLAGFVSMCEVVHMSLTPDYRYATLRALQARDEYDRKAATEGKQGRHIVRPVLVADHEWKAYLVRHSEFITQLRVVHMQTVSDNFLKGRMAELGCEYQALQAHGPGRRGHAHLAFYRLADDMTVPHHGDD